MSEKKKKKNEEKKSRFARDIVEKRCFDIRSDICLNILGVVSPNLPPARNERTRGEQPWPSG